MARREAIQPAPRADLRFLQTKIPAEKLDRDLISLEAAHKWARSAILLRLAHVVMHHVMVVHHVVAHHVVMMMMLHHVVHHVMVMHHRAMVHDFAMGESGGRHSETDRHRSRGDN